MTTDPRDAARDRLVDAAVLAPSSHNTQPWRFAPVDGGLAVIADRGRRLPVNDPLDRELTISCGAAITNVEVAARRCGFDPDVAVLPDPGDDDLLAVVGLTPLGAGDRDASGFAAIAARRTTRRPFGPGPVAPLAPLATDSSPRVRVVEVDAARRPPLADLVAQGDRAQFADRAWRRELAGWMRPRGHGDGLPARALTAPIARAVVSRIDLGRPVARKDHRLAMDAPLLVVVGSDGDEPSDWIEVGRQLERLLLHAAAQGCQAGFLNQPCQVAALRPRLRDLVPEAGEPQLVLRIGAVSGTLASTPRRPTTEVTARPLRRPPP